MTDIEIVDKGHIELGFVDLNPDERLTVCDHIDLIASNTGAYNGEYQEEMCIYCRCEVE